MICNGCGKEVEKTTEHRGLNLCPDCFMRFKKREAVREVLTSALWKLVSQKKGKVKHAGVEITREDFESFLNTALR